MQQHINVAHAIVILKKERATEGVMHALSLLEAALPLPGSGARRAAFAAAHERIETARLAAKSGT